MNKKLLLISITAASLCLFLILFVVLLTNKDINKPNVSNKPDNSTNVVSSQTEKEVYTDSKSFLKDEKFLDEEQPSLKPKEEKKKKEVKLIVSSVSKDIRVTVTDKYGNKVKGVPFYIEIEDVGEYKDLDKDGYIYIAGIKPGTYEVSLAENDDYSCKENIDIEVFETVQYAALDDIKYSIVQEKDINVEEEDRRLDEVYKDDTENTSFAKKGDGVEVGIDVSAWQKEIDWEKVKASGVEFAILRCGYRGAKTGALVEDSYFYKNLTGNGFADIKCVKPPYNQHYDVNNYFDKDGIAKTLQNFSKEKMYYRDSAIVKHHQKKYQDKMPIWVMMELMTCSSVSMFYHALYISDKEKIADKIGISAATLENHLHALSVFRNKCSHGVRLYNSVFNPPIRFNKSFLRAHPEVKNNTLFAYILMLIKRLPTDEDRKQFRDKLNRIIKKYGNSIDMELIGFPKNYREMLYIRTIKSID